MCAISKEPLPVSECVCLGRIQKNSVQRGQEESQWVEGVTSSDGEEQREGEGSWGGWGVWL